MTKSIYNEIQERINHYLLFNTITLKINLIPNGQGDPFRSYIIKQLNLDDSDSQNDKLNDELKEIVTALNKQIKLDRNKFDKEWQVFYLIKEILQKLENIDSCGFNYFRGQSSDWSILPGILRENTSTELKNNFEQIYRSIAYNYPDELDYVSYRADNRIERAKQLSLLQHYGLKTSLLDITRNPFIALLFIFSISNKGKVNKPCFELYSIDEDKHFDNHLFIKVQKDMNNKRIEAQKGAFLNYDYLYTLNKTDIEPINRFVIQINFNEDDYKKALREDLKSANEMIEILKSDGNKNQEEISIIKDFVKDINERITGYNEYLEGNNKIFDVAYENLRREMLTKLKEYYYFDNHLYPDLDKQIEFMMSKYSDETKKQFIAEI